MAEKATLIIADDVAATRENIGKLLEFHPDIKVVGQAASAQEAIDKAKTERPDVILMDINMPGMDGITATEILSIECPETNIIMMSVQGEKEYLRRAMMAGAKNYLVKPFSGDELVTAVKKVQEMNVKRQQNSLAAQNTGRKGKVITVFSTKGGIGKTTIATNLAVAMSEKYSERVVILDADLQFGDVALFLNMVPRATLADIRTSTGEKIDAGIVESYLVEYNKRLKLLAAPLRPEQADLVTGETLTAVLQALRTMFDYIIVDTAPVFNEPMLAVLDESDQVLVVAALDLPTIKNIKLCLEIMESLEYPQEKIKLLLNRANSESSITLKKVEETLKYAITATFPSDGKIVVSSVNQGIPFVIANPDTEVAKSVYRLADLIADNEPIKPQATSGVLSKVRRLFS